MGEDPATWSPLELTALGDTAVSMTPGQLGVFYTLPLGENISLETSDPSVVNVTQPSEMENAGVTAVAPGTATVTVVDGFPADGEFTVLGTVTVTVSDPAAATAPGAPTDAASTTPIPGSDPAVWSPLELTVDLPSAAMTVGQTGVFYSLPLGTNVMLETSDSSVVQVMQPSATVNASVMALAPGTATVTIVDGFPADADFTILGTIVVTVTE